MITAALTLVLLVLCVTGIFQYTLPHWREYNTKRELRQANCSHSWSYGFVYDDRRLPYRYCKLCPKQEHLDTCPMCQKVYDPKTGRMCDD